MLRCLRFHVFLSQSEFGKLAREIFKKIVAQRQTEFLSFWVYFLSYFAQFCLFTFWKKEEKFCEILVSKSKWFKGKPFRQDGQITNNQYSTDLFLFPFSFNKPKSVSVLKRGEFFGAFFNNEIVYICEIGQK